MKPRIWSWAVKLAVSAALLGFILSRVPFVAIGGSLAGARPGLVLVATLLSIPIVLVAAWQIKLLLDSVGSPMPVGRILEINLTTEFYALFVPGSLAGGALRWYRLHRAGSPAMRTLAVVVYNRWMETTVTASAGLAFWALGPEIAGDALVPTTLALLIVALVASGVVFFHPAPAATARRWLEARPASVLPRRVREKLGELLDAARELGVLATRTRLAVAGLCGSRQALGILAFYGFARSLDLDLSLAHAGFARSVVLLLGLLPISLAGIGVREGSLILLLGRLGIADTGAVALGFLLLARDLVVKGAGGWLEARDRFRGPAAGAP